MTKGEVYILAKTAHFGQTRRNGDDYFDTHVTRVANAATVQSSNVALAAIHQKVAYLHDVVEDTFVTLDFLREVGVAPTVVEAVDALTRRHGEMYPEYLVRAAANPRARFVKIRDVLDNLADQPTPKQVNKYVWALRRLLRDEEEV